MTQFSVIPAVDGVRDATFSLKESLGSGGVASVYRERIGQQDYAVKIYTDASTFEAAKIEFMIAHPPADSVREVAGIKYPRYAWPLAVTREKGASANPVVGYAMPVIDATKSKTLDYFFDHNLSQNLESARSKALSFKIEILRNLSESIEELHKAGHIFVDLKPQNVRVFEGTNIVTFLDCDGFTIGEAGGAKRFQSTMVSPDYVAPEITRRTDRNAPIGVEQDEYALAVMIFQMLNNGIHPFQGIIKDPNFNAPTNDDKAALGLYPHGITPNPRIIPRPQSLHDTWLEETRFLLDRAFVEGNKRPTATEWKQHFDKILTQKLLVRCSNRPTDVEHIRFRDKSCPACLILKYRSTQARPKPPQAKPATTQNAAPKAAHAYTAPAGPSARPRKFLLHFALTLIAGAVIIYGILWKGGDLERWAQTAPPGIDLVSNYTICRSALELNLQKWATNSNFSASVHEAKRRGLSEQTCRQIASGLSNTPNVQHESPPVNLTERLHRSDSDKIICLEALDSSGAGWEKGTHFAEYVAEAKARGLDINACRAVRSNAASPSIAQPSNNATWYVVGASGAWTAQAHNTLNFEDGFDNKFDRSADAWETIFVSNRTDRKAEDIRIFVETSSNQKCRSPQEYFNQVLNKNRNLVGQTPTIGSSNDFDWIRVEGKGYKNGSNWDDTFVRDFIVIPKQNRNIIFHLGGRFYLYEDVHLFDEFASSMRFTINPTIFPHRC